MKNRKILFFICFSIASFFSTSTFAQDESFPESPQGKDIQVGQNVDGTTCYYCGPHDWRGCDTPGNACN